MSSADGHSPRRNPVTGEPSSAGLWSALGQLSKVVVITTSLGAVIGTVVLLAVVLL